MALKLHIRDPRAHALARRLAEMRRISMTEAVIEALEAQLKHARRPLAERLSAISSELRAKARHGGHEMSKEEMDAM